MRLGLALLVTQIFAAALMAQTQYGGVSGGEVELLTKGPRKVSGSLGVTRSSQALNGYEATLGGTLIQDRVWFFAAASLMPEMSLSSSVGAVNAIDARLDAQLGRRSTLGASFSKTEAAAASPVMQSVPATFLSLRYTGVVSDNIFFNA
ncbi:MAG: hypothetical protein ACXW2P_02940, partial [Thermoanaerobaculia bacterium]